MRPQMMNNQGRATSSFPAWRDVETEIERLPAAVRLDVSTRKPGDGQTRVTFVEEESTDDE
jgi:hypothetical protein